MRRLHTTSLSLILLLPLVLSSVPIQLQDLREDVWTKESIESALNLYQEATECVTADQDCFKVTPILDIIFSCSLIVYLPHVAIQISKAVLVSEDSVLLLLSRNVLSLSRQDTSVYLHHHCHWNGITEYITQREGTFPFFPCCMDCDSQIVKVLTIPSRSSYITQSYWYWHRLLSLASALASASALWHPGNLHMCCVARWNAPPH